MKNSVSVPYGISARNMSPVCYTRHVIQWNWRRWRETKRQLLCCCWSRYVHGICHPFTRSTKPARLALSTVPTSSSSVCSKLC